MNKYRGEVPIDIGDRHLTLRYNMTAIAALKESFGDQAHVVLNNACSSCDVKVLATGIAIGLERNHPGEFTQEKVLELSPPVRPSQQAVYEALMAGWYGGEGPPELDAVDPTKRLGKRIKEWLTQLFRRNNTHSKQV